MLSAVQCACEAVHASIATSPIASVVSNPRLPTNPIVAVNAAFCALTGYGPNEIVGRNCRFLAGPDTEPWLTERITEGVRARQPVLVEILNYRKDMTSFRNAVLVAPAFDQNGVLEWFFGSQVRIADDAIGLPSIRHRRALDLVARLSPRQRQVLVDIGAGYRTKQIAYRLALSEKTVKMHRALLFGKLQASNAAEAIRIAIEAGL